MVRFLSCMDSQVALQSLKVPETGATDFTGIGLLSSVDEHMGTEVGHLNGKAKHERLCWGGLWAPFPHHPLESLISTRRPRGLFPVALLTCTNLAPHVSHL